jgi:murein DD-endopeptidase MepM/ murein hydrolase activator NlpD
MVNPVPGYAVSTAYRKTGPNWKTCGYHTGQDYSAPAGTNVVAARGGIVEHVDYGDYLGYHQFVIRPGDGTEDFYAHTTSRPSDGAYVAAGDYVAEVGEEGNATGPHLHFERHSGYGWSCSLMVDPMLSHNAGQTSTPPQQDWPEEPTGEDDDDMLIIQSDGRGAALIGPGYYKSLTPEERDVMLDLGIRLVAHNDRGFDVARAVVLQGQDSLNTD